MNIDSMLYVAVIMMYGIMCFIGYILWKLLQSVIKDIEDQEDESDED